MSISPQQLTLPLAKHRNHYLFSDYYLDHLLPRRLDWQEATSEARAAMKRLQTIYAAFTPTENEAQTERDWIRPVLETLDHVFEVQPSIATPDGVRRPDYVFFPTDKGRQVAKSLQGQEVYPTTALAVGDAKHWDRSLDQTLKGDGRRPRDPFTNRNPSWQIYFYMLHTDLAWGILTNGRAWRLYHKDTAHKLNYYYEVDLAALLGNGDVEAFKYFYLFFRQASFIPNGEGRTWLDIILQESRDYAQGVSEDLKDQVYEALRHVAQGFLDYPGNDLTTDPDTLKAIHDNSLILLYRLLFVLYAESRGLLPVQDNETYRLSYSLDAIKKEIERTLSKPILPTSRLYWTRLQELFGAINEGNEHLGVPAYNGDLFDPQTHPFLEQHVVGDQELRQAIDNLARTDTGEGRVFVDYRDLEVRHLGSIYEGLLEYQLRYAEEDLAVVKERRRERYVPAGEGQEVAVPTGRVYLVTDRGERKATGSYYTPGYIVKYIVEQTLQPLLGETLARWADRKNVTEEDLVNDVLSLDVLDPAMGSGHFLVEATEYIARYLVGLGLEATAGMGAEAELDYWKRRVVQACIYGVDLNPLAVELAKLSLWLATVSKDKPLSFLDHHLRCGNSLIGARVADLGAAPVVKKRHRKAEEEEAAGQLSMFDDDTFRQSMMTAVDSMWLIEGTDSSMVEGVKEQERIYRELREELTRRYRLLADLWTARYFGVVIEPENQVVQTIESFRVQQEGLKGVAETKEVYSEQKREKPVDLLTVYRFLAGAIQNGWTDRLPHHLVQMIEDAQKIAKEKHFFHWELEFPEIFFDRFGRPLKDKAGFDTVVGNPPYVKANEQSGILAEQRKVLVQFPDYAWLVKKWDLYVAFIERGYRLLRNGGRISLIVPDVLDREEYASALRSEITELATIDQLDFFPQVELFPGVGIRNLIFLFAKMLPSPGWSPRRYLHADASLGSIQTLPRLSQDEYGERVFNWQYHPETTPLLSYAGPVEKIAHICYVSVGMVLNADEKVAKGAFTKSDLISDKPNTIHTKRYADNESVFRYELTNIRYLEYGTERVPDQVRRPTFPELHQGSRLLIPRSGGGTFVDGDLICDQRIVLFKPWHELKGVENRSIAAELRGIAADSGLAFDDLRKLSSCYNLHYILAIVNCPRMLEELAQRSKRDRYDFTPDAFRELPIRCISFTTSPKERERLVRVGITEATEWIEGIERASVSSASFSAFGDSNLGHWLDARLTADPEQSDVVHDLLAHLAERMIAMNKEKQSCVEAFWLDLEGVTDAETFETLRHRGKWERTLWKKSEACRSFVSEESRSTRYLDESLSWNEEAFKVFVRALADRVPGLSDLVGVYRKHRPSYRELVTRIETTDRLIDLIVYRLYGLTEEEVAVVEGE